MEPLETIVGFAVDIGMCVIKEDCKEIAEKQEIEKRLRNYLLTRKKLEKNLTYNEEIVLKGLGEYLKEDLIEDVQLRLFGKKEERKRAREQIISRVSNYIKNDSGELNKTILSIVENVIDILRDFYRKKSNRDLRLLTTEIEETIEDQHEETRQLIEKESREIKNRIENNCAFSIDSNVKLMQEGELNKVENNIDTILAAISTRHSLYPYYGYGRTIEGRLVSVPRSEEAVKLYPPKISIITSSIKLGEENVPEYNEELVRHAYMHQLPINMTIDSATKLLGTELDPVQEEVQGLAGSKVIITPPKFPPAVACAVYVDNTISVPYLLLRVVEILEDNTYIVTNEEQANFSFRVELRINLDRKKISFSVDPKDPTNREMLSYYELLRKAFPNRIVAIKILEGNVLLCEGRIDAIDVEYVEFMIPILKKVILIEDLFGRNIHVPEKLTTEDYKALDFMSALIENEAKGTWTKLESEAAVSDYFREWIHNVDNETATLSVTRTRELELFGEKYPFPVYEIFESAKIKDFAKVKDKVTVCDSGDVIKVVYIPDEEIGKGEYIAKLYTEEIAKTLEVSNEGCCE